MKRVAISAAEVSGDLIGASLVKALKAQNPTVEIEGLVGPKMLASGARQLWDMRLVNVMGFSEVLKKLPSLLRLQKTMIDYFSNHQLDVFIGIDAPDFNFKIERFLKKQGVKTVHLVSPSVWAWRASRVKKIKKSTDLILCLLPFEVDFYRKNNQKSYFIGHPLAQNLQPRKNHIQSKRILLLPGSRKDEIKRLLPEMCLAVKSIKAQDIAFEFHLALANDECLDWANTKTQGAFSLSVGDAHKHMRQADLAISASGTATLELALVGVPMVVIYKMSRFSYWIASKLLKSSHIALPNVIVDKTLVPELIQNDANGANIARHALDILADDNHKLIEEFVAIHAQLDLDASAEAAKIIQAFVNE